MLGSWKIRVAAVAVILAGVVMVALLLRTNDAVEDGESNVYPVNDASRIVVLNDVSEPVAGAEVRILIAGSAAVLPEISPGEYELPAALASNRVAGVVRAKTHASREFEIDVLAGHRHEVVLLRLAHLELRIVDRLGHGVADARIRIHPTAQAKTAGLVHMNGVTDAAGLVKFRALRPETEYTVAVGSLGKDIGNARKLQTFRLDPGETRQAEVILQRDAALRGTVLDFSGMPVARAVTRIMRYGWVDGAIVTEDLGQAVTDADGRFVIRHDVYGPVVLKVTWRDQHGGGRLIRQDVFLQRIDKDIGTLQEGQSVAIKGRGTLDGAPAPKGSTVSIWVDAERLGFELDEHGDFLASVPWTDEDVQIVVAVPGVGQSRMEIKLSEYSGGLLHFAILSPTEGTLVISGIASGGGSASKYYAYIASTTDPDNRRKTSVRAGEGLSLPVGSYLVFVTGVQGARETLSSPVYEVFLAYREASTLDIQLRPAPLLYVERREGVSGQLRFELQDSAGIGLMEFGLRAEAVREGGFPVPQFDNSSMYRLVWWPSGQTKSSGGTVNVFDSMMRDRAIAVQVG